MLKSILVAVALWLGLPAPAPAQDGPTARAIARRDEAGVFVRYRLPEAVRSVAFADRDIIRDRWSVTTPGLALVDGAITGDQPFDAFELKILPDAAEVDRIYVGLSRAGEGRVLYGPGLMLDGVRTALTMDLAAGEAQLPQADLIGGYAYVGPAADVALDAGGAVVTGANVAPDLKAALRDAFFKSLAFYHAKLGAELPFHPALIGTVDSPGPNAFRGDVTGTGVISVRFFGEAWRQELDTVVPFVWHETFHLWNGHGVETRDGDAAPWLHEGGADYAALVGAVSSDAMSEANARDRLMRRVNGCRRVLGDRDMDPGRLRSGNGPYDCGVLIQWIADLEARQAGRGDVFTLWRTLLDAARAGGGYGVSDFRALLGPDSAVAVVLDEPGVTRWATVKARLADLGVALENRPGAAELRAAALFHVGGRNCKSAYGFYDNPGALKLDGADCGVLSGEPVIAAVEGHDPQTESRAMFDAVQARCADALPVRYLTQDGRTLEAVCDRPLVEPEVWAVADAPPLAISIE